MNLHARTSCQFADLPATVCVPTSRSSYHPTVNGKVSMQKPRAPLVRLACTINGTQSTVLFARSRLFGHTLGHGIHSQRLLMYEKHVYL